jgi:hypothetical protein
MHGGVEMLLAAMDARELDPFLVFATVLGMDRMARETCIGPQLEALLVVAASQLGVAIEDMISSYRDLFYGTSKEGKKGVRKVRSSSVVSWGHSKKKEVLLLYLQSVESHAPQMPTLIQIIYAGDDLYSGARTHRVFKNAQDAIVACQQMLCDERPPLSIMEVPNKIQGSGKFYIDWDMRVDKLAFLVGTGPQRIEQARALALQAPAKICEIFVELGYISDNSHVQIVIKEGSRAKVGGSEIHKISFHFVFNLFGTTAQLTTVWKGLFAFLEQRGGTLWSVLRGSVDVITDIESMHGYASLVGVDMHPYSNPEQGLAMGFSKKHLHDPYTRFLEILHVTNQTTRSETPCCDIWIGRQLLPNNKPPDIRYFSCFSLQLFFSWTDSVLSAP